VVIDNGQRRDSDRSSIDITITSVLEAGSDIVVGDGRRIDLGKGDAAIQTALIAMATAHHSLIAVFSRKSKSFRQ